MGADTVSSGGHGRGVRRRRGRGRLLVASAAAVAAGHALLHAPARAGAANFVLKATDPGGTSSLTAFNSTAGVVTPSAGNTYNTASFVIRSPNNATSLTFGGNSLEIDGGGGQLLGKSTATAASVAAGTAGALTFQNLILNGGLVREANATNDGFGLSLNGTVTVNAASYLSTLVGESLYVNATINGSSGLTFGFNTGSGATSNYSGGSFNTDQGTVFLTANNNFTGPVTINGGTVQVGTGGTTGTLTTGAVSMLNAAAVVSYNRSGAVTVANNFTGAGTIRTQGSGTFALTGSVTASGLSVEAGTTNISGAQALTFTGLVTLGDVNGSTSTVNLTSTGTNKAGQLFVGQAGTSTGIVNQTAGLFQVTGGNESRVGGGGSTNDAAAVGFYNLVGGTLTSTTIQFGAYGTGYLSQTGGTFNASGFTDSGRFISGYGMVDVSGTGVLNQTAGRLIIGEVGTGFFTVRNGGAVNIATSLGVGQTATGVGVFNLDAGGTLTTPFISLAGVAGATATAGSSSTFNFNGGTLKSAGANANFFVNLTNAYVFAGGANIDTTGGSVTLGQPLLAPGGGGVTDIAVTAGGSGYVTAPVVKISGGGGSGATAIANVSGGVITGITIVNPGTGYTSAPTVALVTGLYAPATAATLGTANTAANVGGSLTKLGANTLTLGGANTYPGATNVVAGTLASANVAAFPSSTTLNVGSGAAVNLNGQYVTASLTTPSTSVTSLMSAGGATFGFNASSAGVDGLNFTAPSNVTGSNAVTIAFGIGSQLAPGTYNLLTDAAGGLGTNTFTLAATSISTGGVNYPVSLSSTDTADVLTIGAGLVAKLYYTGAAGSDLSTAGAYASDLAGTMPAAAAPTSITDVVLTASSPADTTPTAGSAVSVNSLEFSSAAAVTIGGSGTITIAAGTNTFAAGTGIVVDAGAGAATINAPLALGAAQSFTNNSANPLTLGGGIATGANALTLNGVGGFAIGGPVTGNVGMLTFNSSGGVTLTGANTYAGTNNIASGTVTLGSSTALGSAANPVTIAAAGTLNVSGQSVAQSTLTLAGGRVIDGTGPAGTLSLTPANGSSGVAINVAATYANPVAAATVAPGLSLPAGGIIVKSVATGTPVFTGNLALGGATTFVLADSPGDPAGELSVTGVVSGAGPLVLNDFQASAGGVTLANQQDFGTLTLTGSNTYTGGTNIASGRIVITNGSALGTGPITLGQRAVNGSLIAGGGTLSLGNSGYTATSSPLAPGAITGGITVANDILFGGAIAGNYGYGIYNDSGVNTLSGTVTLTNASQIVNVAGGSLTFSGPIGQSSGNAGGLTKTGAATLTLSGVNTYTGVTQVNAGTLSVADIENGGVASNIGAAAGSATLVLNGGTLLYTGAAATTDRGYTLSATSTLNVASGTVTFGGQILASGTSGITKVGTGTVTYTNTVGTNTLSTLNNTFGYLVNNGAVVIGAAGNVNASGQLNVVTGEVDVGGTGATGATRLDINGGTTTINNYITAARGDSTTGTLSTINVSSANLNVNNGSFGYSNGLAGYNASAVGNFSGTTVFNDAGLFRLAESNGSTAVINLTGTAAFNLTGTGNLFVGDGGTGTFNQSGGTVALTGGSLVIGNTATGVGVYNLGNGSSGSGVLTTRLVNRVAGSGILNFNGGTLQASNNSAGLITNLTAANVGAGGALIDTQAFTVTVGQNLSSGVAGPAVDGGLTKLGSGTLVLAGTETYTGVTNASAGTVTFPAATAGGGIAVRRLPGGVFAANAGAVVLPTSVASADRTVLVTGSVGTAGLGRIDLGNGDLISQSGNLAAVTAQAAKGFAGGLWNGSGGLSSSSAAADANHLTAVGVIQNDTGNGTPFFTSFDGQPVTTADVLARYTYYGDTNLDGSVTAADYTRIDAGFVGMLTGWANGDFNYDGLVDGSDYALMDNAFNQQVGVVNPALSFGSPVASPAAQLAGGAAAVPEPSSLALAVIGSTLLLAGRRRQGSVRRI